jgi:hypothetical protein
MATWRAQCWLGSEVGYQDLEVQANTWSGAKSQLERIYGAEQIINLHEVSDSDDYSSSGGIDGAGILGLAVIAFIVLFWKYILIIGGIGIMIWGLMILLKSSD